MSGLFTLRRVNLQKVSCWVICLTILYVIVAAYIEMNNTVFGAIHGRIQHDILILNRQDNPEVPSFFRVDYGTRISLDFIGGRYMDDIELVRNLRKKQIFSKNESIAGKFRQTDIGRIVWNLSDRKLYGIFVDIGAGNGRLSKTGWLESEKNWTGVLIEADPLLKTFLQQTGRNVQVYNTCVGLRKYSYIGAFGCLPDYKSHLIDEEKWEIFETVEDVLCYPAYTYMLATNYTSVDLLSLDINGDEITILKTIPWNKLSINIILVRYLHVESRKDLIEYLTIYSTVRYALKNDIQHSTNKYLIFHNTKIY